MDRTLFLSLIILGLVLPIGSPAQAATYKIDPEHSSIMLKATHLGIGTVNGQFNRFSGAFEFDPTGIASCSVSVVIDASSIDTNQSIRDDHLRSSDFLDVKKYPEILFTSRDVRPVGRDRIEIAGDLTLRGVTRSISFIATMKGTTIDLDLRNRAAFHATIEIQRKDFGFTYNRVIGAGTKLVGETIQIILEIEGVEQPPDGNR